MIKYLDKDLEKAQLEYRTVAVVLFAVAILTLCARMFVGILPDMPDLAIDAIFTTIVQILLFLLMPFLVYKFVLKKNVGEIAEFSSVKKIKWHYIVIAALVGVCAYIVTIGISTIWQTILIATGYTHSSSATVYPSVFNPWIFLAEMVLTAVLPAICEEFLIRGGTLSVMRGSFGYVAVLMIMGVIFGLFHQNVTQVFYTACFGTLMAFLTIKLDSIFPAVVIHFVNNGLNVFLGYADAYKWPFFGGWFDAINSGLTNNPTAVLGVFVLVVFIGIGLVTLMMYMKTREKLAKQKEVILDAAFDQTNKRVVMMGEENKKFVEQIGMQKQIYGKSYVPDALYKPTVRDNAFMFGALAVTALSTVATYVWGLF